jgi:Zn-dependent peptidase ImmA (M78 family)
MDQQWTEKYNDLASKRFQLFKLSMLFDKPNHGMTFNVSKSMVFIFVSGFLSPKEKLMTLAHEYGHLLSYNDKKFKKLKTLADETCANETAIKILEHYDISRDEFMEFYCRITGKQDNYCGAV